MKYPSFYTKPEMAGHIWAKENFDLAIEIQNKYTKTTKQKKLFNSVVNMSCDDWHIWLNTYDQKYLMQVRFCLRHLDSMTPYGLYCHIEQNHAMLKSDLLRYLELRAYTYNNPEFVHDYCRLYGGYGMNKKEAMERCVKYIQSLTEHYSYQI